MEQGAFPALIHCFTASAEFARKVLDLGLTISFPGSLPSRMPRTCRRLLRICPKTGCWSRPMRRSLHRSRIAGQVCEPAFTADTARFVATLRGQSPESLAEVTTRNFFKLFGKAA
jgi:TatD DNase family protein